MTEVHKVVRVGDGVTWFDQVRERQAEGRVTETLYGRAKCLERGRPLQQEQEVELSELRVTDPVIRTGDVVQLANAPEDWDETARVRQGRVVERMARFVDGIQRVAWEDGSFSTCRTTSLERVPLADQHPDMLAA